MKASFLFLTVSILCLSLLLSDSLKKPYLLPKIVWTHWDSSNPPEDVKRTVSQMRKILPDWDVRFLTTQEALSLFPSTDVPANFDSLGVAHQADWIRLKLLKHHGGCWIDSGIILNQSINPLYRECVSQKANLLVFKILGSQSDPRYPIAENWFIMAPANSPVVTLWLEEFEKAIDIGFQPYKQQIKQEGVNLQKLMTAPTDVYLTQHGCYQKVIQQRIVNPKIVYHVAEDSMFKIHANCKWDSTCISNTLKDTAYCKTIPYIKLRGADRKQLDLSTLLA